VNERSRLARFVLHGELAPAVQLNPRYLADLFEAFVRNQVRLPRLARCGILMGVPVVPSSAWAPH
jgi:hypothetical protein